MTSLLQCTINYCDSNQKSQTRAFWSHVVLILNSDLVIKGMKMNSINPHLLSKSTSTINNSTTHLSWVGHQTEVQMWFSLKSPCCLLYLIKCHLVKWNSERGILQCNPVTWQDGGHVWQAWGVWSWGGCTTRALQTLPTSDHVNSAAFCNTVLDYRPKSQSHTTIVFPNSYSRLNSHFQRLLMYYTVSSWWRSVAFKLNYTLKHSFCFSVSNNNY